MGSQNFELVHYNESRGPNKFKSRYALRITKNKKKIHGRCNFQLVFIWSSGLTVIIIWSSVYYLFGRPVSV